jgi:hypothetical protein
MRVPLSIATSDEDSTNGKAFAFVGVFRHAINVLQTTFSGRSGLVDSSPGLFFNMEVRNIFTITGEEIVCVWTGLCQVQTERSRATDPGTALYTNGENIQTRFHTDFGFTARLQADPG